ncbi:CPBP family intramembrane glutamic endopeptidase [Cellvibrio sp. OA-2007]|uniref:CPBP family intramembrane glutamic endopeptidase n=1 Tax=Cellvibrio sp. OA-2007 TaxID=529823 RepID=UPI000782EC0B|nr:CPBP family intramembrane glutamic endopeptidase [Cellvibrio sp. OA-2007]
MKFTALTAALHPRQILRALDAIDRAETSYTLDRPAALRRVIWVLACVSVSLLVLHYAKFSQNLQLLLGWLDAGYWPRLQASGWLELCGYLWWTLCHLLTFIVLPWLVIRYGFKQSMLDFGWRWNQVGEHWRGYLLLLSPILVFVVLVSFGEDFVNHYPFYRNAGRSWLDFLLWELLYMSQFVFLEFFFRGFMVNALRPAIGANAIWVMCVPYMMIHLPKLALEATGAILFGLFLGILALQSRSIWGGVLVHAGVALSMDIAALLRKQELPGSFFPF